MNNKIRKNWYESDHFFDFFWEYWNCIIISFCKKLETMVSFEPFCLIYFSWIYSCAQFELSYNSIGYVVFKSRIIQKCWLKSGLYVRNGPVINISRKCIKLKINRISSKVIVRMSLLFQHLLLNEKNPYYSEILGYWRYCLNFQNLAFQF